MFAVVWMALGLGRAPGQDYRATVQGTVTDSSGAIVAGATVTLRNDGTSISFVKQTNEAGHYSFSLVEPGTYTLTADETGFARFVRQSIVVQVRGDITVDATLSPGALAETVTVAANVQAVQFNSAAMDLTIDRKELEDMPILGRNPFSLALLNPAVQNLYSVTNTPPPFYMWAASSLNIGGPTYRSNEILLDGVSVQVSTKASYAPPMDAVQEFTVEQNSVDAEFGHTAGGVLSLGMKSGTNEFHGTASYYGRNPLLNAVVSPITRTPSLTKSNIWGGTFGNPIKKNRLFNFFSYEGWKQSQPSYLSATMPTNAERSGDFSQSKNISGGQLTVFNPWSTLTAADGTVTRTPFSGNVIPSQFIDPAGQAVMNDLWSPNNPGDDLMGNNNYKTNFAVVTKYWNISDRVDYYATDKLRSFVRYSYFNTLIDQSHIANSAAMPNSSGAIMNALNIAGDTVYTLSPTTMLDFRLGYAGFQDDYANPQGNIGQAGLSKIWGNNAWYEPYTKDAAEILYPSIYLSGASWTTLGNQWQWYQRPEHFTYSAKVAREHGRHSLKAGWEGRWDASFMDSPSPMSFDFDASTTANTYQSPNVGLSGSPLASLLLGSMYPDPGWNSYASWNPALDTRSHYWGAYFQDDIKVTRRLTLNLGLRWEWESALREINYRISRGINLSQQIPEIAANPPALPADVSALRTQPPQWTGAWLFSDSKSPYQFDVPAHEFLPRIGVAYRVTEKSALRFGYARNVVPTTMVSGELSWVSAPFYGATSNFAPNLQGVPGAHFGDPFPSTNPLVIPSGNSLGMYSNQGNDGGEGVNPAELVPQVNDRLNFSYQRELPGHFTFDGSFFLMRSRYVPRNANLNMADPNLFYTLKAQYSAPVDNPFYNYLTPAQFPGDMRYKPTIPLSQLLRPYPAMGDLNLQNSDVAHDHYHAFQFRAQRAFSHGASFLFTYYYGKDTAQQYLNDIAQYNNQLSYIARPDPRHRISAAGTYNLPFGKGGTIVSTSSRLLDGFIGGWSFSSIFTWHSGSFVDFTPGQWASNQMTVVGDPGSGTGNWNRWFNTAAFAPPQPYTPRTNPWVFEGLAGPRFWNIDSTLAKTFDVTERFKLKFRMEAYNLTNSFMPNNPSINIYSSTFGVAGLQQAFGNSGRTVQYSLQLAF